MVSRRKGNNSRGRKNELPLPSKLSAWRINLVNFCFSILFYFVVFQAIPETFSVRMIKDGGVFDENVTINVAEQTATFHVPLREGADEANVVHDFRKVNSTFAVLKCYLFFLH